MGLFKWNQFNEAKKLVGTSQVVQQLVNLAVRKGGHKEVAEVTTDDRLVTLNTFLKQHNPTNDPVMMEILKHCYTNAIQGGLQLHLTPELIKSYGVTKNTLSTIKKLFGKYQIDPGPEMDGGGYMISW
jgi:hypothetical protein